MLRLWLTRRWIVATFVAVLFAVSCFFLGLWQWSRHVEQRTKVAAIEHNYDADPVPLTSALELPLTAERQWTRVHFTGAYAVGSDLLVRNRALDKTLGYEVLTPFATDGRTILVDRGWVPSGRSADRAPEAEPPPAGEVEVNGWLRTGEVSLGKDLPAGQLASINIADAQAQRPELDPLEVYVVLGEHEPAPAPIGTTPVPLPRPDEGLGPHQAYAVQWWLSMPGGFVFVWWAMRRELLQTPETVSAARRPKKVRIWDEEDA